VKNTEGLLFDLPVQSFAHQNAWTVWLDKNIEVERATKYLKHSPAILMEEYNRIVGIVNHYDVLEIKV